MGDGDGWVLCRQGHRHWGRLGAAGLLLIDEGRVVLQHRAERTHEGNTWGLPGGARDSHEDAVQTALREANEEAGIEAASVDPVGTFRVDHGGWSYTTVVAAVVGPVRPRALNWESTEVRWWEMTQVEHLALHPGFNASWPTLRHDPRPVTVVVDMANLVGARPDGWWRDRLGAARRLVPQLTALARDGIPVADLPAGLDCRPLERILARMILVVEGAASPLATPIGAAAPSPTPRPPPTHRAPPAPLPPPTHRAPAPTPAPTPRAAPDPVTEAPDVNAGPNDSTGAWWLSRVTTVAGPGSGDDQIVVEAGRAPGSVVVVTADRGLRRRLNGSVHVVGPQWMYALLPAIARP